MTFVTDYRQTGRPIVSHPHNTQDNMAKKPASAAPSIIYIPFQPRRPPAYRMATVKGRNVTSKNSSTGGVCPESSIAEMTTVFRANSASSRMLIRRRAVFVDRS